MDLFEVVGWVGAVLVLFAYWLVTKFGTSPRYHVLNLVGAAGLLVNALHHGAFPSTTVNLVWAAIAVWGLAMMTRRRAPD
jgi:formate hydrogenlyase subunit 3/multisubunit Na+/H+ antiporter MnhD subunit